MLNYVAVLLNVLLLATLACAQEYELIWSDEFNGTEVDTSKWDFQLGTGTDYGLPAGWGNDELQFYRHENARIEDNMLAIDIKKEVWGGRDYTSARIRTANKFDFRYGRVEARIKIPSGPGIWSAFWMLPTHNEYGGWAASGEIDIMEAINDATEIHGTIHHGGEWPNNQSNGSAFSLEGVAFSDDFHLYALEWEERRLRWFVDGKHYLTLTSWFTTNGEFPAPFDKEFHLLLNVAVGGNWPGAPDASTVFPQKMLVDWVRVYQVKPPTGVPDEMGAVPGSFRLQQNFPNPFNPGTIIRYSLAEAGFVSLKVLDVTGKEVAELVASHQEPGNYQAAFSLPVASGIYFYRMKVNNSAQTRKMLRLR